MPRPRPMPGAQQPGGRPRGSRHLPNAFSRWLEGAEGRSVTEIAAELDVSRVSVYHLRDGRFSPGRDLAVRIETLTGGAVPVASWGRPRPRARRRRAAGRGKAAAASAPAAAEVPATVTVARHASDEALTLAYVLLSHITEPKRRRAMKILPIDHDLTAARWALDLDELAARGASWEAIQRAIELSQRRGSRFRQLVTSGAGMLRWWPDLSAEYHLAG